MILHTFIKIHVWFLLISGWCPSCWQSPMNVTLVNVSDITSVSLLQGWFLFNPYFMCDRMASIYECSSCANLLYAFVWSEAGHWCILLFLLDKTSFVLVYSLLLYVMCASAGLVSQMTTEFQSYVNLEVYYMFSKVLTRLLLLVNIRKFYTLFIYLSVSTNSL